MALALADLKLTVRHGRVTASSVPLLSHHHHLSQATELRSPHCFAACVGLVLDLRLKLVSVIIYSFV
jgi:hypothetical protein